MAFWNMDGLFLSQFQRPLIGRPDCTRDRSAESRLFEIIQRLSRCPAWGCHLVAQSRRVARSLLIVGGRSLDRLQDQLFGDATRESHVYTGIDQSLGEKENVGGSGTGESRCHVQVAFVL